MRVRVTELCERSFARYEVPLFELLRLKTSFQRQTKKNKKTDTRWTRTHGRVTPPWFLKSVGDLSEQHQRAHIRSSYFLTDFKPLK